MTRIRNVGGKIIERTGGKEISFAKESIVFNSSKTISFTAKDGTSFSNPEDPPKKQVIESAFKFESTYIYNHLLAVAKEMVPKFNPDDTSIIYKFYKAIIDGKIVNLPIEVSTNLISGKAFYDLDEKKIIVWETTLLGIEKNDDKKIKLLQDLTQSYSDYLNDCLQEISTQKGFEAYEYDMFRFDAMGSEAVIIGQVETPIYKGSLNLSFAKTDKPAEKYEWKPDRNTKARGPNTGEEAFGNGPGDPPAKNPNIGIKFSYSLNGGFLASLYVGVSTSVKVDNFGAMGALNTALTYYGKGSVGTSSMSPTLVTLSATPSITLGYKTGNALEMNLFNNASGSGVWNPYEYAFTIGTTGILSSGNVSRELNPETGEFGKNKYNSHDVMRESQDIFGKTQQENNTRNQIVGGAAIKVGNFMIASFNDIYKPPLFFGMGSDQYWSAGINMQLKLPGQIKMAYAVDMYYGKSNNKNPLNQDKMIGNQNYDYQQLFDVLLNRGQETFSLTDAYGNLTTKTKFGFGTFWPTNAMHDSIAFPDEPKDPKKPIRSEYQDDVKFNMAVKQYGEDLKTYETDKLNYDVSNQLKVNPTFHHLYVVYNEDNKMVWDRLKKYLYAGQSEEGKVLKEFYLLDNKNNDPKK